MKYIRVLKIVVSLLVLGAGVYGVYAYDAQTKSMNESNRPQDNQILVPEPPLPAPNPGPVAATSPQSKLVAPISNPGSRVTKKPFGLRVSPNDSPVSPERFSGYHSGVDFETTEAEQDADVQIFAVCTGQLLSKRTAQGYGGIVVQECKIANQRVTIIYGHMKLSSVSTTTGTVLNAGDKLGVLGDGYTSETDNERKHLHLGIYKGSGSSILGYVSTQSALNQWLNILDYL